eukprot:6953516-Pyramimonas_sp.AAC.1
MAHRLHCSKNAQVSGNHATRTSGTVQRYLDAGINHPLGRTGAAFRAAFFQIWGCGCTAELQTDVHHSDNVQVASSIAAQSFEILARQ